jgi:osmoprotectant transport system ATP-binding protein
MLSLRNASKRHGSTLALAPLNLELVPGKVLVIIGESGSGKSTCLRLLGALDGPTEGELWFEGQKLTPEREPLLRQKMGVVVQGGGLFPHLSARRNVTLVAEQQGLSRDRIEARLAELTELARIPSSTLDRFPLELSGGQAQRISLMRGLMLDPQVILLDEPLGALDPITRYELQADLKNIFSRLQKTVVLVTHDMGEAMFFADRILVMHQGRVIQDATPHELITKPAAEYVSRLIKAQRGFQWSQGDAA